MADPLRSPLHPLASKPLPVFVVEPGQPDVFFDLMVLILVVMALLFGVFYFRLLMLPRDIADKGNRTMAGVAATLALIALFTQNHVFWIAGVLLASIRIPDVLPALMSAAESLQHMAGPNEQPLERKPPIGSDQSRH